jgi:hypothetical protein
LLWVGSLLGLGLALPDAHAAAEWERLSATLWVTAAGASFTQAGLEAASALSGLSAQLTLRLLAGGLLGAYLVGVLQTRGLLKWGSGRSTAAPRTSPARVYIVAALSCALFGVLVRDRASLLARATSPAVAWRVVVEALVAGAWRLLVLLALAGSWEWLSRWRALGRSSERSAR